MTTQSFTVYFSQHHDHGESLVAQALLAESLSAVSDQRYLPVLPQNLTENDDGLSGMVQCDTVLFADLDWTPGDVEAFLLAKWLDIPAVCLQTGKPAPDLARGPLSQPLSDYGRTAVVSLDARMLYRETFRAHPLVDAMDVLVEQRSSSVARSMVNDFAMEVMQALDRVIALPPMIAPENQAILFQWASQCPGLNSHATRVLFTEAMRRKKAKGLLA